MIAIAIFQPYKHKYHNVLDEAFLVLCALRIFMDITREFSFTVESSAHPSTCVFYTLMLFVVFIYFIYGNIFLVVMILPTRLLNWLKESTNTE